MQRAGAFQLFRLLYDPHFQTIGHACTHPPRLPPPAFIKVLTVVGADIDGYEGSDSVSSKCVFQSPDTLQPAPHMSMYTGQR